MCTTEEALSTSVRSLALTMQGSITADQEIEKKTITNQITQFLSNHHTVYLVSPQQIHDCIRVPPMLTFIQELATARDFCSAFTCYKQTNFMLEGTILHLTTQKDAVTLQEQVLLTCSLLHEHKVSVYHNAQCTKDGLLYQPIGPKIPPLAVNYLNPVEHNIPCRTAPEDLINSNIIVLYNQDKQAFQCISPVDLLVDGIAVFCDNQTLHWVRQPGEVVDVKTGDRILEHKHFKSSHIKCDLKTSVPLVTSPTCCCAHLTSHSSMTFSPLWIKYMSEPSVARSSLSS